MSGQVDPDPASTSLDQLVTPAPYRRPVSLSSSSFKTSDILFQFDSDMKPRLPSALRGSSTHQLHQGAEVSAGKPQHHQGHQPHGGDVSVHLDSPKDAECGDCPPEEVDLGLGSQCLDAHVSKLKVGVEIGRECCTGTCSTESSAQTGPQQQYTKKNSDNLNIRFKEGLEDTIDLQKLKDRGLSFLSFGSRRGSRGSGSPGNCSKTSSGIFCRICHDGEGSERLISPCQCAGSVALVHLTCIEKWLSTINKDTCELCHHKYIITRHPKAFSKWLCEPAVQDDQRNLLGDLICFLLLTPLAAISTYLCATGAAFYLEEKKSESIGLISLCVVLVVIYIIWVLLTLRYHIQVWYVWRESNQDIRLSEVGREPTSRLNWRNNNNHYQDIYQHNADLRASPVPSPGLRVIPPSNMDNNSYVKLDLLADQQEACSAKEPPRMSSFGQECTARDPRITPCRSIINNIEARFAVDILVTKPLSREAVSATNIGVSPNLLGSEQPRRSRSLVQLSDEKRARYPEPEGVDLGTPSHLTRRPAAWRTQEPPRPDQQAGPQVLKSRGNVAYSQHCSTNKAPPTQSQEPNESQPKGFPNPPLSPLVNCISVPSPSATPLQRNDGIIYSETVVAGQCGATEAGISRETFRQRKNTFEANLSLQGAGNTESGISPNSFQRRKQNLEANLDIQSLLPKVTRI